MMSLVATRTRPGAGSGATPRAPTPMASAAPAAGATVTTRSGAASRVGPSFAGSVLHKTNLPSIDVCTVQLVQSPFHVGVGAELNHALVGALLVGICVSHFSCLTHKILKVLPTTAAGQVFHDETILSTDWWSVLIPARAAPAAVTATVAISISPRAPGMFDDHPLPAQLLPVQLIHGVIGVPVILELHEAITVF